MKPYNGYGYEPGEFKPGVCVFKRNRLNTNSVNPSREGGGLG